MSVYNPKLLGIKDLDLSFFQEKEHREVLFYSQLINLLDNTVHTT